MKPRPAGRWLVRCSAVYLAATVVLTAVVWWWADEWWPATLVLFGPRWAAALPLAVLAPVALFRRSARSGILLAVGGAVVAGPLCGGHVRTPDPPGPTPAAFTLRVMTWNTGGASLSQPAFRDYLDAESLDLVVLQEARAVDERHLPLGWKWAGGPTGTVVLSRYPLQGVGRLTARDFGLPGRADRVSLETPRARFDVVDLHLPTPRPGLEAVLAGSQNASSSLQELTEKRRLASAMTRHWVGPIDAGLIVCGDFNMPVESGIYRRDWSAFGNAFSAAGIGWGTTKQTHWFGTRIDHILYAPPWRCQGVRVGPAMGSDHRPVLATLSYDSP